MENTTTSEQEQTSCFSAIQIFPPTDNQITICERNCHYVTEAVDQLRCNNYVSQVSNHQFLSRKYYYC